MPTRENKGYFANGRNGTSPPVTAEGCEKGCERQRGHVRFGSGLQTVQAGLVAALLVAFIAAALASGSGWTRLAMTSASGARLGGGRARHSQYRSSMAPTAISGSVAVALVPRPGRSHHKDRGLI